MKHNINTKLNSN